MKSFYPALAISSISFLLAAAPTFADVDGVHVQLNTKNAYVVEQGQLLYAENCASCHGDNLEGQDEWKKPGDDDRLPAPPHDDTGHTWHHADDLLFEITKYGLARMIDDDSYETNMPIYEGVLEDPEIISILTYIKSTWTGKTKSWNDQVNAQFDEFWEATPTVKSLDELQGKGAVSEQ